MHLRSDLPVMAVIFLFFMEILLCWTFLNIQIILNAALSVMSPKNIFYKFYSGPSGRIFVIAYRFVLVAAFVLIAYIMYSTSVSR